MTDGAKRSLKQRVPVYERVENAVALIGLFVFGLAILDSTVRLALWLLKTL